MLYESHFRFHPPARRTQPDSPEIQPHRTSAPSVRAAHQPSLTAMNILDGPEELSPCWLTDALRESGVITDATVESVRVDPASVRKGNLGRLDRIVLEYDHVEPGAPMSIITKFHPSEIELRKFVAEANRTEVRFYEEVAPNLQMRTPRRYFSAFDEDSGKSLLLLEDLGRYRVVDEIPGCTVDEAELITDRLASLARGMVGQPAAEPTRLAATIQQVVQRRDNGPSGAELRRTAAGIGPGNRSRHQRPLHGPVRSSISTASHDSSQRHQDPARPVFAGARIRRFCGCRFSACRAGAGRLGSRQVLRGQSGHGASPVVGNDALGVVPQEAASEWSRRLLL